MCLCASVSAGAQSPAKAALPLSIYLSDRGGEIAISAEIAISIYLPDRGGATRARVLPQLPAVLARVVLEVAKLDAYEKRNTASKKEIQGVGPRGRKA